jgi:hypothetical protein
MIGAPGPPAEALFTESGSFPTRIALKIWSAVAVPVRCGSGVITGVGATVGGATLGGAELPQAAAVDDSAISIANASAPRTR